MRTRPPYDTAAMAAMVAEQRDNLMPWLAVIRLAAGVEGDDNTPVCGSAEEAERRRRRTHGR